MSLPTPSMPTVKDLEHALGQNTNIMGLMRERGRIDHNTPDAILLSYDLQSGSYTALMEDADYREVKETINRRLAEKIKLLGSGSLLEVGVGEASTLCGVAACLGLSASQIGGMDISWSRLAYSRQNLQQQQLVGTHLFTGDIAAIPLADNTYDIVYTAHSLEPNGGRERECLRELYRVCRLGMVLFEPAYELGNESTKKRITEHGYCRGLASICREMGGEVIVEELFAHEFDYNQSQIIIVRKPVVPSAAAGQHHACPTCKQPLIQHLGHWFCQECYNIYPIIDGIPCLLPGNGILATKFMNFPQ